MAAQQKQEATVSIQSYFKVVDAPLAIVVGGVAAVLIVLQLGAVGLLAQSQMERATERDASVREVRLARARCLGVQSARDFAECSRSSVDTGNGERAQTFAVR